MSLPTREQDASIAGTYEARPGASDAKPAGLTSTTNQSLSSSVKNSLDTVADSTPSAKSVTDQLPSTQSITEQLPSAQSAADAVKAGANSLIAGVSSLALGTSDVVADNASASHPESDNARTVDEFHIPGAFEDATDDAEDKAVVQQGLKSAYNSLPSTQGVKNSLPGAEGVNNFLPSAEGVKSSLPDTEAISKQMPNISGGSFGQQNTDSIGGNSRQGQVHQDGIDHIKGQLQGQNVDSVGGPSRQGQVHQDGIEHIKQQLQGQNIGVGGAYGTTSQLAGQVPLEPRGVPQVVSDSQRQAGVSPEASSNAEAVQDKKQLERELKREVPESSNSSSGFTGASAGLNRGVPQVVADSQKKADASPEASANAEAVHDKQDMERELKREISQQSGVANTPVDLGEAVSGGLASAGAALAGAATYARNKTQEATGTDPVAVLPESAQRSIDGEVTSPSNTRGPQSSSTGQQSQTTGQSVTDTLAGGAAAVGSAAAGAATYAREKTHETTGTDPVSILPTSAQQAIDGNARSGTSSRGFTTGSGNSGITDSLAAGASSASSSAANAATYVREKTHEASGTDPVSVLPTSIQRNIDGNTASINTASHYSQESGSSFPRVVGEPVVGGSNTTTTAGSYYSQESSSSFPRVVGEPVVGGYASGVDLQSGVHNGVVGDHLDDESRSSIRPASGTHSGHWQPGSSATVAHVPSLRAVDLSAGVKNTVVGSGAEGGSDAPSQ